MKPFNMRMFTSLFGLVVLLKLIKTTGSLPTAQKSFPDIKKLKPSLIRKIHLYSKQGHYIAILENGTVVARLTRDSPDSKLLQLVLIDIPQAVFYFFIFHVDFDYTINAAYFDH